MSNERQIRYTFELLKKPEDVKVVTDVSFKSV